MLRGFRICFLAGTLGQGGAERQLFYMLKSLVARGAEVNLLSLTTGEHWEAPIRRLGIPIHFVGGSRSRLLRLRQLLNTLRRLRPQIVQCQHFYTNIYAAAVARCLRIPSIGAVRSDGLNELKSNGRFLGRLSLTLPNWIAANSGQAIGNLRALGFDTGKFFLIPNVVDTEWFSPGQRIRSDNAFVILGVGSLETVKRFDRFLEIAVGLKRKTNREVRVIIAGDGRQRQPIEALAEQARQKGVNVELPGRVADPLKLYQSADVLLLTSDREGTPNVIMEAMACGLPVVATNVGGVADLVKNSETGFLFEPNDQACAVAIMERLAAKSECMVEMGQHARAFIENHHSTDLLPEILAGLYAKALPSAVRSPSSVVSHPSSAVRSS
jgi:glycosyltransferase involved in cell wall biosynthesis